ncbi:MAG: alpha-ketoglutarate-dependent dioxygenase AlkB [Rhizobacter sp.]|nr:alpha-ketoglutarate-dependent dioxygenase AlkB [Rhizobacter sp.]
MGRWPARPWVRVGPHHIKGWAVGRRPPGKASRASRRVGRWCNDSVQPGLFSDLPPALPAGSDYVPDFITPDEERQLLRFIDALPLQEARYKEYTARRRVVSYGGVFDYDALELRPAGELPLELHWLCERAAQWLGVAPGDFTHVLVAEYRPGTPLGWHRDVPEFECVVGVSLGTPARLRFRPYPPDRPRREDIVTLEVAPRSVYKLTGPSRWGWQHSVPPVETLRYSITLRTPRGVGPRALSSSGAAPRPAGGGTR